MQGEKLFMRNFKNTAHHYAAGHTNMKKTRFIRLCFAGPALETALVTMSNLPMHARSTKRSQCGLKGSHAFPRPLCRVMGWDVKELELKCEFSQETTAFSNLNLV